MPQTSLDETRGIEASVSVFVTMLEAKVPAPIYLLNVTVRKYTQRDVSCQLWVFLKLGEMRKKKMTTWNQLEKLGRFLHGFMISRQLQIKIRFLICIWTKAELRKTTSHWKRSANKSVSRLVLCCILLMIFRLMSRCFGSNIVGEAVTICTRNRRCRLRCANWMLRKIDV